MCEKKEKEPKPLYGLQEIANWGEEKSTVTVPALQRGLVWKANQMELLWDSILRGFPIGSFVIASFPEIGKDSSLHLLDGQQRMNAIKLGFKGLPSESEQLPVLWYDLTPKENPNSTRKHWIKACTPAHPWGYRNDDTCTVLNAHQKREACKKYSSNPDNINYRPSTRETWPADAEVPIPLSVLVHAIFSEDFDKAESPSPECVKQFTDKIIEILGKEPLPSKIKEKCQKVLNNKDCRDELYKAFSSLKTYRIATAYLPQIFVSDMQNPAEGKSQQVEEVECLFDRMNTMGTRISSVDLHYSVIKAHFPPELKDENEKVAEEKMPPAHLVMLALRLALSPSCFGGTEDRNKLHGTLSLTRVRRIAREEKDEWRRICSIYGIGDSQQTESPLHGIASRLNGWLKYEQKNDSKVSDLRLPPALVLKIILHSPEVYLLLMWLLREDKEKKIVSQMLCLQLATLIHWFSDKKSDVCNAIVKECTDNGTVSIQAIRKGLLISINQNWLRMVYPPLVLEDTEKWKWTSNWQWDVWHNTPYWDWLIRFREEKEILLYAQRHYLAQKFPTYDPANIGLFSESNRPWDMDHIIPRNWISGKWGSEREFCKQWLNNIGNFAAIPFEINRSKSDNDAWDEYTKNAHGLLFDERFPQIGDGVASNEQAAQKFADATKDRMIKIYTSWYGELGIGNLLKFDPESLPTKIAARRDLFLQIKEKLGEDANCYFVQGHREYSIDPDKDIHFCKEWLSVGIEVDEKCLVCLSSNTESYEIGIRKAPGIDEIDRTYKPEMKQLAEDSNNAYTHQNSGWWYILKTMTSPDIDEVTKEIEYLIGGLKEEGLGRSRKELKRKTANE